ncbi:MAG: hypothetical protein QOF44_1495 [Streptomyces sp.]|jgi:hypothetical protein|nr:hypothetical protein [Streptomyces sp.]
MNVEQLVRDTFHEISCDAPPPPPGLADRVLHIRRRRRIRTFAAVAGATAAVIIAAVAVPVLGLTDRADGRPASVTGTPDVIGHPDQSPPRDLIAAGGTAVSAYWTSKWVLQSGSGSKATRTLQRTWHLYNTATGRYDTAPWAYLDVAPGMRTAAVLEGPLPSKRVGLLDTATGKVTRWIDLDHPAGGVSWSPKGDLLAVTTYSKTPETMIGTLEVNQFVQSRTGYYIVDPGSGTKTYHELPQDTSMGGNMREDMKWSRDGSLLKVTNATLSDALFYDLQGHQQPAPKGEESGYPYAGLSPDGRYLAGDFAGNGSAVATEVLDAKTGKRVATQPVQELIAWADNDRLIAWGCDPKKCDGRSEFANQLLLVDVSGEHVTPLSGFRKASATYGGRWTPLFTAR